MKEHLQRLIENKPPDQRKNIAREYLQARILGFIQDKKGFSSWIFHGGTALRFLYDLQRYSENLDFTQAETQEKPAFKEMLEDIARSFQNEGYAADLKFSGRPPVSAAFIRFPGLPNELGLSGHAREMLAVKIEVDTRPPAGGKTETTIVRRHLLLNILHHDRATLLAGKLHALLNRSYTKGRDLYDLFWYLSDRSWPAPNLEYLNNALRQTEWPGPEMTVNNWKKEIAARLHVLDWPKAVADVSPFIERSQDLELITLPNLEKLLGRSPF
ncbi:MAG: nucleotidyl transferase AbiEii/AbiGii toxin family protein [Candidatus Aminicenantes bacterium]|nr:nucleotidyl transferase AbiEii/AbiGii toxin family protein [Candidatus Aminicenantes bacterium]